MLFTDTYLDLARATLDEARAKGLKIATAESCTGGLIAGLLTEIPGSSDVVERGFVTYSNEAKQELLGVAPYLIETFGAVSAETARAMTEGALSRSHANIAVSVTGVAGPGGGTAAKPVGLVHFGVAATGKETQAEEKRFGDLSRTEIRLLTAEHALTLLRAAISAH